MGERVAGIACRHLALLIIFWTMGCLIALGQLCISCQKLIADKCDAIMDGANPSRWSVEICCMMSVTDVGSRKHPRLSVFEHCIAQSLFNAAIYAILVFGASATFNKVLVVTQIPGDASPGKP